MSVLSNDPAELPVADCLEALGFVRDYYYGCWTKPYRDLRLGITIFVCSMSAQIVLRWSDVKPGHRELRTDNNIDHIRARILDETGGMIDIFKNIELDVHPEGGYYL